MTDTPAAPATKDRVRGPASYFPSIEKTHGRPVGEWLDLIATRQDARHTEAVAWLKAEHGLGHGHANALVAHARAWPRPCQCPRRPCPRHAEGLRQ